MNKSTNKTLKTKSGLEYVVKPFITTEEKDAINDVLLEQVDLTADDSGQAKPTFKASSIKLQRYKSVEAVVVSIGGDDNVLEAYKKTKSTDGDEIYETVEGVVSGLKEF